jgi:hypothetical protein
MASVGAMWAPVAMRLLRVATTKATKVLRTKISNAVKPIQKEIQQFSLTTASTGRQAIHPIALLRQQRRGHRLYSTTAQQDVSNVFRRFFSGGSPGARHVDRSKFPTSKTSRRVAQFSGRAPFASTLRPNLTGGAIPRTAGGYTLGGGGARYFSHTPAAPAEVIQNVSNAVRGFWISGKRVHYDGADKHGCPKYRVVSSLEDEAFRHVNSTSRFAPGSFIDFQLSPTVTALSPLTSAFPFPSAAVAAFAQPNFFPAATLNTEGILDELSADFARAFEDLAIIFGDLKRLSALGDLPIILEKSNLIRVRFPGVDALTVERLCDDLGIRRGLVGEDAELDVAMGVPIALRFPFAPDCDGTKTITSPGGSLRSLDSADEDVRDAFLELEENPWFSDPEGYESMSPPLPSAGFSSRDFEGLEGVYKFLEECDRARDRF